MSNVRLTVLIVDDEPQLLGLASAVIEALGHDVVAATSGHKACEIIQSDLEFDLLITDINMKPIDGFLVTDLCLKQRPGTPVVMASGFARDDFESEIFDHLNVSFMQKPYTPDQLEAKFSLLSKTDSRR